MKIVHVVDSMEVGGAETMVAQMCRMQRDRGHDPSVYAIASLGLLGEQLKREGFVVEPNLVRHISDGVRTFYRMFKRLRPDVVHLHNPTPTVYAAISARFAGVRRVISTRHSLVAKPRRPFEELKYGVASICCDRIVGICDATCNNLKSLHTIPKRKIVRVYNGTEPITRVPLENCPSKTGFTLLFVGRLAPVKNLRLLLNAFHIALASRRDLRLWMVGDGSERAVLECLSRELGITSEVTFWGEQLDVAPFFSAADVFVMSSLSEGLPMSLLQAFSLGMPAIVTDVGGMAEIVRSANAGIAVPGQRAEEMANAIVGLSSDAARRERHSMNGRAAYQSHLQLTKAVDAYLKLYAT